MNAPSERQFVVDCEYSAEDNALISMAIVPLWLPNNATKAEAWPSLEFYEVVSPLPCRMSDWVKANVVPRLDKMGISFVNFQTRLQAFLIEHQVEELHYDWCEDIAYFNRALVTGPGERLKFPHEARQSTLEQSLSHVHHPNIESNSRAPHNALEDARAIAEAIRRRIYGLP